MKLLSDILTEKELSVLKKRSVYWEEVKSRGNYIVLAKEEIENLLFSFPAYKLLEILVWISASIEAPAPVVDTSSLMKILKKQKEMKTGRLSAKKTKSNKPKSEGKKKSKR